VTSVVTNAEVESDADYRLMLQYHEPRSRRFSRDRSDAVDVTELGVGV
jgi:hypothetical protein